MIFNFIDPEKVEELDYRYGSRLMWVTHLKEIGIDVEPTTDYANYFSKSKNGSYRFVPMAVANDIMSKYPTVYCEGLGLLVYEDGVYKSGKEMFLRQKIQELLGFEANNQRVAEVIGQIERWKVLKVDAFNLTPLLNVKNGLLNVDTGELIEHSPMILTTIQLPIEYDPNAQCPNIKKFINEVVPADTVPILEEWFGYCLFSSTKYEKALMLTGTGANGKSVLMNLFQCFIGKENICHHDIQDFEKNRFATASLFGKLANTSADLPASALKDTGIFKKIVTGDDLQAENKGQKSFTFKPYSRLMFSANELPTSSDLSEGFFRRWIIINFPFSFIGKNADPNLLEKLVTVEELSGLLNVALQGIKRLRSQGGFTTNQDTKNALNEYKRANDKVIQFLEEECVFLENARISKMSVYRAYSEWCKLSGYKPLGLQKFYKSLHLKGFKSDTVRANGKRAFSGIALRIDSEFNYFNKW
ncbi:DNA primase family protein [Metabacillus iocasae]|uniref:DNA primase/helicase n=1 Tax=Priestia iocasae TaxID=2291674 RepID=A0ABS2QTS9_9BACI|nr:phage/plasmid primase, P4 family [Metabacillus iocasae]MBM7702854.1 putative DNA primase/helicase [Metabacillus iocasae]